MIFRVIGVMRRVEFGRQSVLQLSQTRAQVYWCVAARTRFPAGATSAQHLHRHHRLRCFLQIVVVVAAVVAAVDVVVVAVDVVVVAVVVVLVLAVIASTSMTFARTPLALSVVDHASPTFDPNGQAY